MSFVGFVTLEQTLYAPALFLDAARTPVDLDAAPTVRIYGPDGLLPLASATGALLDTGSITAASNASPIVITSAGHQLTDGTYVTVRGVGGNDGANGSFLVTVVDVDTFSLDGSVGTGDYTSGGTWNVVGLYRYAVAASSANGFEVGDCYTALVQGTVQGTPTALEQTFIVV